MFIYFEEDLMQICLLNGLCIWGL